MSGAPATLPRHGIGRSLLLHLGPGLVMLGFYWVAAPRVESLGFPPLFASLLSIPLILVPWMLGYLFFAARREGRPEGRSGRIRDVVHFNDPVPRWHYYAFGVPVVVWGAFVFQFSEAMVAPAIREGLDSRLPPWFLSPAEFDFLVAMPTPQFAIFSVALLLFAGIVAPWVEELYFRGHLMAGLARFGLWAPTIHVALFTLYHFESPWENPARFLMVLPLAYVVWFKKSLTLAIVMHVALNLLSALALILTVSLAR